MCERERESEEERVEGENGRGVLRARALSSGGPKYIGRLGREGNKKKGK